jgi:flagellin
MGQVINTNSLSLLTQNNLNKSQGALNTSIQRLSSGMRINSAKDDAAGQAIANRFTANIKGLTQAQRNANDGISLAQTTEGALNEINNNLQRVRELTVQSANGSNSAQDKASIQAEIFQRLQEIDRTSTQTDFNGVKVLSSSATTLKIQVGANDGETIDIGLKEISTSKLGLASFNVSGPEGTLGTAQAADYKAEYGATTAVATNSVVDGKAGLATRLGIAVGGITFDTAATVDSKGNWFAKITLNTSTASEIAGLKGQGIEVTSGVAKDFYVALDPQKADVTTLATNAAFTVPVGTMSLSDMNTGASTTALKKIDDALKLVDDQRGSLGAVQNRFDSIISNLGTTITNLSSSRSRIEDADYATEVSNMTRAQILQQAGTSVLAKANQSTQGVMSLLQ